TLDTKEIGKTPLAKPIRVNLGTHTVAIAKPGFETLSREVTIKGHEEVAVEGPLEKEITTGHVNVTFNASTNDATAKVLVDGKEAGPAPYQADLEPGTHTFEAKGDASFAASKQVDIAKKGKYDIALDLKPADGILAVSTGTPDGEITVDGKVVGRGA